MWDEIITWICKWWVELVLTGIAGVFAGVARHYFKLAKDAKKHARDEQKEAFKAELKTEVKALIKDVREEVHLEILNESSQVRDEIAEYETNDGERLTSLETRASILENTLSAVDESLNLIKQGLLAVQGHEFRNKCRKLLTQDIIKSDEFEQLENDHAAYNGLGGNHKGDSLFDQVKTKYYAQLTK